jgi:hypothetical protein
MVVSRQFQKHFQVDQVKTMIHCIIKYWIKIYGNAKGISKSCLVEKSNSNLEFDQPKLIKLYSNYQGAITSLKNPKFHVRKSTYWHTIHFIKKKVEMKEI